MFNRDREEDEEKFRKQLLKVADLFLKYVEAIAKDVHTISRNIIAIGEFVFSAKSATLTSEGEQMLVPLLVGKTSQATFTEWDGPNGAGNKVPPVGTVVFESDNKAIATVDANGVITAVAAGTCNISGLDQGNNISASGSQVVTAAAGAQSATIDSVAL